MKVSRMLSIIAVLSVVSSAASLSALDLGEKVKDTAKDAGKGASKKVVESEINKDLKKHDCSFKPKSTDLTCDLSDILNTLRTKKVVAEQSGFANDVDVYVEVGRGKDPKNPELSSQRSELIRSNLKQKINYWDWYDQTVEGDKLNIYVKIE